MRWLLLFLLSFVINDAIAYRDTLYFKKDSSLVLTYTQSSESNTYMVRLIDKTNNLVLYDMPGWAARSHLVKMPNNFYHIVVRSYLPEPGKKHWKKYELTRFILWVGEEQHSFFKSDAYANYPTLKPELISQILTDAEDIYSNSFIENEAENLYFNGDSYVRNIGMLALGVLNNDSACLERFNEVWDKCTGGEGCEAYRSIQKCLSYKAYELRYRNKQRKRNEQYLVRRKTR